MNNQVTDENTHHVVSNNKFTSKFKSSINQRERLQNYLGVVNFYLETLANMQVLFNQTK